MSDPSITEQIPLATLLLDEQPLLIFPRMATAIGLNESITLQQLHYWMKNPAVGEYHEGRKWIYNTYEQWQANFPFWSLRTIQGIMLKLEKEGLVDATDKFNRDPRDRTKWYTINLGRTVPCTGHANLASSTTQTLHGHHANLASSSIDKDYVSETTAETTAETSVSRARKSSQIPPQFSPSPKLMQWCIDEHFEEEDVLAEVPQFVDYWLAKGEPRKDWDASFRTWMRNSRKFGNKKKGNEPFSPTAYLMEKARKEKEAYEQSRDNADHHRPERRLAGEDENPGASRVDYRSLQMGLD